MTSRECHLVCGLDRTHVSDLRGHEHPCRQGGECQCGGICQEGESYQAVLAAPATGAMVYRASQGLVGGERVLATSVRSECDDGDCCCCPEDLHIKFLGVNPGRVVDGELEQEAWPRPRQGGGIGLTFPRVMNKFAIRAVVIYKGKKPPVCDCTFELWEKDTSGRLGVGGTQPSPPRFEWQDQVVSRPRSPSVTPWLRHLEVNKNAKECPGRKTITMHDEPFDNWTRYLMVEYRLKKCPGCQCANDELVIRGTQQTYYGTSGWMGFTFEGRGVSDWSPSDNAPYWG